MSESVGGLVVPYVIARSEEIVCDPLYFYSDARWGVFLSYQRRRAADWLHGILRARVLDTSEGEPMWRQVNTLRQWRCMDEGLCQVCGREAAQPGQPMPWILTETAFHALSWRADAGDTNAPPTCWDCIPVALEQCPRLGVSAEVVTVAWREPIAVLGDLYRPGPGVGWQLPSPVQRQVYVGLDEFARHPRVLANQLVVRLHGIERGALGRRGGSLMAR
ncbi:hypothetical protein [Acrocarpospora catenulata]|uniref:hypothetical protein n=1 Tax=Acrocarpospora catenulata TaxID=2836182 RepID=UPI001BD9C7E4|nr:hypothetical protein [Acrocarpospora catenulata]